MPEGMTFKENLARRAMAPAPAQMIPGKRVTPIPGTDWPQACARAARIFSDAARMAEAGGDPNVAAYFRDLARINRRNAGAGAR